MPTMASSEVTFALHDVDGRFFVVFGAFDGGEVGALAAGHQYTHERGVDAVGGRELGGVEHGDPSAGTGAGVEEAPAMAHPLGDLVDGVRDARCLCGHGCRHEGVLFLDDANDFGRGKAVDVEAGLEPVLTHCAAAELIIRPMVDLDGLQVAYLGVALAPTTSTSRRATSSINRSTTSHPAPASATCASPRAPRRAK